MPVIQSDLNSHSLGHKNDDTLQKFVEEVYYRIDIHGPIAKGTYNIPRRPWWTVGSIHMVWWEAGVEFSQTAASADHTGSGIVTFTIPAAGAANADAVAIIFRPDMR